MIWWRGPDWHLVRDVFTTVSWEWVVAAIGLNLLSIVVRARVVAHGDQAGGAGAAAALPQSSSRRSASASSRTSCCPAAPASSRASPCSRGGCRERQGVWATLIGSVFAHRLFDLFPALTLVVWVLFTAKLPHWAVTSIAIAFVIGFAPAHVRRRVGASGTTGRARRARHGAHAARVRRARGSA